MTNFDTQPSSSSTRFNKKKEQRQQKAQKKQDLKKVVKYSFTDYLLQHQGDTKPPKYDYTYT